MGVDGVAWDLFFLLEICSKRDNRRMEIGWFVKGN